MKMELEGFHAVADAADWAGFVMAMGGPTVAREDMTFRPWTRVCLDHCGETVEFDTVTGQVLSIGPDVLKSAYGEVVKVATGLVGNSWLDNSLQHFKTRFRSWVVRPVRDALSGAQAPPWSSVNNCTEHIEAMEMDYLRGAGESSI